MGKTVTTYLIDGDPKGTQYAFISNKICQMFVIPRSNLAYLNEQEKRHIDGSAARLLRGSLHALHVLALLAPQLALLLRHTGSPPPIVF